MRKSFYDFCTENGKENLLTQWDSGKNLPLTPHSVTYGSRQKILRCCKLGHEYQAAVSARTTNGSGCPVCAGRVKPERLERYATMMTGP